MSSGLEPVTVFHTSPLKPICRFTGLKHHLADVDPGCGLSLSVSVAQLGDGGDGIETSVLRQRGGNDLEGISVGSHTVSLHAAKTPGVFGQP